MPGGAGYLALEAGGGRDRNGWLGSGRAPERHPRLLLDVIQQEGDLPVTEEFACCPL